MGNEEKKNQQKRKFFPDIKALAKNLPAIEFSGNKEAIVEGSKGILEYTTELIRINTGGMIVVFSGRGLNIKCLTTTSIVIKGYIKSVEFVS